MKIACLALLLVLAPCARADYSQRFSLGVGFALLDNASEAAFSISGEYEYRVHPVLGVGAVAEYVFVGSGVAFLGAPEFFVHPFATEFLVSAAPLLEIGSAGGTAFGARLGTRVPIPLGSIALVPEADVDLIAGGPLYTFGLGIEF